MGAKGTGQQPALDWRRQQFAVHLHDNIPKVGFCNLAPMIVQEKIVAVKTSRTGPIVYLTISSFVI